MFSHRQPRWEHWLLNEFDEPLRLLDGVEDGSITLQGLTRLGGNGELVIADRGQDIDWMRHRVRHIYDPGVDGVEPWSVATFRLTSPNRFYASTGLVFTVETLPMTQIVDEDAFDREYSLPAGANIVDAVVTVLESCGVTRMAVTASSATLSNPQAFEAGESKLTIVNALLQAAGYWSLWCDGDGVFRVEPYTDPSSRPASFAFEQGAASIHLPEWEHEQNLSAVPNKAIVRGVGDEDAPPLVGVSMITDPMSPFSFEARGNRWVTITEDGFEGANQAAFDQRAEVLLRGALSPIEHVRALHALVPVWPNEVIEFRDSGYEQRLTVQNMTIPFALDGDVEAEWRRTGG